MVKSLKVVEIVENDVLNKKAGGWKVRTGITLVLCCVME